MNEVVIISPDKLSEIVKDAVARGVGSAMAALYQKMPKEMDEAQASEYLCIPRDTLRTWRSRGIGPAFRKHGRIIRYAKAALDSWLENSTVVTADSLEHRHERA